jgi:hypothetical protein
MTIKGEMFMIEKLKQRFCKDNNITIQLFEEPYFTERLKLMGKYDLWESFVDFYNKNFNDKEDYFTYYNDLKDNIINYIKNSDTYKLLNNEKTNIAKLFELPDRVKNLSQKNVYNKDNVGKYFLSIDMKKANYSALVSFGKMYNVPFVNDDIGYSYEKFMSLFTPYEYFAKSKYIRQVVFGNCNPKRQIAFEHYLMSIFLEGLYANNILSEEDKDTYVYSLNSDEIIICTENINLYTDINKWIKKNEGLGFNPPLRLEFFKLKKISGTEAYLKRIFKTEDIFDRDFNNIEIKCMNPIEAPFIYRFLNNESVSLNDRVFLHEGKKAILMDIPEIFLE